MSCAEVCIDHDYDGDSNAFYAESLVKARKSHKCCECRDEIPVGSQYQRASGRSEGRVWTAHTCQTCAEIRRVFVCGSWTFGMLWESIRDDMFPIWETHGPIDCLAKLDTKEARDKCREFYREWKG